MSSKGILREHHPAYWVIAGAGFLAAVALIFFENDAFYRDFLEYVRTSPPPPIAGFHTARITLDFSNGSKRAFEGESRAGMTILSALRLAGEAGRFGIVTDERGQIVAVAGVKNGARKQWRAYRNGAAATDLPGHTEIKAGDRIVLRYE